MATCGYTWINSQGILKAHFARVSTQEGAFSSSLSLPRELAPKYLTGWISWSILRGGNSAPEDEVYPWTPWYTRRSFAPAAFPWSMLQKQNPSCVSALISTCVALWQKTRRCDVLVLIAVSNYILANSLATTSLGSKFRILQNLGKKRGVNDCHHRWKFWWSRSIVTPTIRAKNTLSTALLYF